MYNITFPSLIFIQLFYLCSRYFTLTEHSLHLPKVLNLRLYFVDNLEFKFIQDFVCKYYVVFGVRIIQGRFGKKGNKLIVVCFTIFISWTAKNYEFIIKILLQVPSQWVFPEHQYLFKNKAACFLNFKGFYWLILLYPCKLSEGKFSAL
jgi:hypothetical protein